MSDLVEEIFDESNSAFEKGSAAALFAFCVLFCWELVCAVVSIFLSIGKLPYWRALLYVNAFGLSMVVLSLSVGALVAFKALEKEKKKEKKEKEDDVIE